MSDIEQPIEQNEIKKKPKIRKDGKPDLRSFNKPPINNAMSARERLSYLLKKGKQAIQESKVEKKEQRRSTNDKKVESDNDYEELQSDNDETDIEHKPNSKKTNETRGTKRKPKLNTRKKKQPKIIVEESSDVSDYEQSESDAPVVVLKKGKSRKKAPIQSNKNDLDVLSKLEKKLSEMEMNYTKKEQERELALQQLKANNDFVNNTRQRMILRF